MLEKGKEEAFSEIYDRYWERLYMYVFNRMHSGDLAFEITQDLFVSLWQRRREVVFHSSLSGYLFASVRYRIVRHINNSKIREKYFRDFENFTGSYSDNSNEESVNLHQLEEAIELSIQELPGRCQEIFRMSRYRNMSVKEIATHLGLSHKTVENQLTIALKHLRASLGEFMLLPIIIFLTFR
jgi:RNA polymerase sigma-70 factor (ECF subfamily)